MSSVLVGSSAAPVAWLIFAVAAGGARAQSPPPPSPPPQAFPVQVELVKLEITVLDGRNRPVLGLRSEDFIVLEDGVPQEIASFEAIEPPGDPSAVPVAGVDESTAAPRPGTSGTALLPPWTYVIFVDDLHLTPPQSTDVRKAVTAFLDAAPSGARIVLIASGARIVEDRVLPEGRDSLRQRAESVRGSLETGRMDELLSDQEAYDIYVRRDAVVEEAVVRRLMRFERPDDVADRDPFGEQRSAALRMVLEVRARAGKRYEAMRRRTQVTLGVLRNALDWLSRVKGRRSVVLASRGFLYDPAVAEFEDVLRASLRANVAISFLDARGLRSRSPFESAEYGPALDVEGTAQAVASEWADTAGAESLAFNSGGMIIRNANDLTAGLRKITDAQHAYYVLGFQSSNPQRDGRFRRLRVRLRDKGAGRTVLGRRGYYAPRD